MRFIEKDTLVNGQGSKKSRLILFIRCQLMLHLRIKAAHMSQDGHRTVYRGGQWVTLSAVAPRIGGFSEPACCSNVVLHASMSALLKLFTAIMQVA